MLKIYGTKPSRVARCLWALEELELEYQQIAVPRAVNECLSISPSRARVLPRERL